MKPQILFVSLAALAPSCSQIAPAAGSDVTAFDWPSVDLPVEHRMFQNGEPAGSIRYVIQARPRRDAPGMSVRVTPFELGPGLSPARVAAARRVNTGLRFDVSPAGRWDPKTATRALEAMAEEAIATSSFEPAKAELVRKQFRGPARTAAYRGYVETLWGSWVGSWVDLDLAVGESRTERASVRYGFAEVDAEVVITNRGADEEAGQLLRFTREATANPESFRQLLARSSGAQVAASRSSENVGFRVRSEVVTDPQTLRPVRASVEQIATGEGIREVRREEFVFDWSAIDGR